MPNDPVPATDTGLRNHTCPACKEALSLLISNDLDNSFRDAHMFARLIEEVSARQRDEPDGDPAIHDAVVQAAARLEERLRAIELDVLDRVRKLCRQGARAPGRQGARAPGAATAAASGGRSHVVE